MLGEEKLRWYPADRWGVADATVEVHNGMRIRDAAPHASADEPEPVAVYRLARGPESRLLTRSLRYGQALGE